MNRLLLLLILASLGTQLTSAILISQNLYLDYFWGNNCTRDEYMENREYVPRVNIPNAIAVAWNDTIWLTVPRYSLKGVPATLNIVELKHEITTYAILHPFQGFFRHRLGECTSIQNAITIIIDPNTYLLYLVDAGRVGLLTANPANLCPAKLWVVNTITSEIVWVYEFPNNVAPRDKSYLSDIAFDYGNSSSRDGGPVYIYISDRGMNRLVIYHVPTNMSWTHQHLESMGGNNSVTTINGVEYNLPSGVKAIAMSPSGNYLYYFTVSSRCIWRVRTILLRNPNGNIGNDDVICLGPRDSHSYFLLAGHRQLYYSQMELCSIVTLIFKNGTNDQGRSEEIDNPLSPKALAQNYENMEGVSHMAFHVNNTGEAFFVVPRMNQVEANTLDITGGNGDNFRIYKMEVGDYNSLLPPSTP